MTYFTSFASPQVSTLKRNLWLALLIATTIALSKAFTCATPFSALAAVAALTLPRQQTILFMLAAWAANQFVGFAFLGYPTDPSTLTWAFVMGVAALVAGMAASLTANKLDKQSIKGVAATFVAAFVGFQFVLLIANLTPLGSLDSFALSTKAWIAAVNLGAFGALWMANRAAIALGFLPAPSAVAA